MIRRLPACLASAAIAIASLAPAAARADISNANVVTVCGTPNVTYAAGTTKAVTQDTTGKVCVNATVTANLSPVVVTTTDKSGSLAAGATAQTAIALNASRKGWCIQNPSTAAAEGIATAESLWIRVNGTAGPNVGTEVTPGNQVCNASGLIDPAAVSIYAVTISHKYNGFEVQ